MLRYTHKHQYIYILVLLSCIATTFFFRCYEHYPSGDELAYKYIWEQDDPLDLWHVGHRFERLVHTPAQAIQSQVIHFQKANGRFWVHAVEQYMSNDGRFTVFCFLNTAIFLSFIYLIVRFVSRKRLPRSILLWL